MEVSTADSEKTRARVLPLATFSSEMPTGWLLLHRLSCARTNDELHTVLSFFLSIQFHQNSQNAKRFSRGTIENSIIWKVECVERASGTRFPRLKLFPTWVYIYIYVLKRFKLFSGFMCTWNREYLLRVKISKAQVSSSKQIPAFVNLNVQQKETRLVREIPSGCQT